MRKFINNLLDNISNIKWDMYFYSQMLFSKEFRHLINSNRKYRNIHSGERCFIVGNGPSLKRLDLTKIHNEIVFTVNDIMSNKDIYTTLNSDYHILIDPNYLLLDPNLQADRASIEKLKDINYEDKKPVCFVRHDAQSAFMKYEISSLLNLQYIYQHRYITDNYSTKISTSKNMPASQNVIQAAIFTAIDMGFKDIYLIGVDMTSVFLTYEADDEGQPIIMENSHAHDYSEESKLDILTRFKYDNEFMLYNYANTFTIFKHIRKYTEKRGVNVFNATKGGGLDVFERVRYESLF